MRSVWADCETRAGGSVLASWISGWGPWAAVRFLHHSVSGWGPWTKVRVNHRAVAPRRMHGPDGEAPPVRLPGVAGPRTNIAVEFIPRPGWSARRPGSH